jgi:hypothetical protein
MGSGAIALGSGDAGVARSMGGEQSHYNPAGLPYSNGNELTLSTHLLSLDRRLSHVSAVYQVPQISFWRGPMRPVYVERIDGVSSIEYVDQTRKSVKQIAPDEYLDAFVLAVKRFVETSGPGRNAPSVPSEMTLLVNGEMVHVEAGALQPVIEEMTRAALRENLTSEAEIQAMVRRRFLRVQQKPAAVALNWTHAGTDGIEARDFDGVKMQDLGYFENRFSLAFGIRLHRTISAGVNAGVLYALVPDLMEDGGALTSTTFVGDAGIQVRPFAGQKNRALALESLTAGAAVYGFNGKNSWNTTGYWSLGTTREDEYPLRYRFGASSSLTDQVALFSDVETDLADIAQLKIGLQVNVVERAFSAFGAAPSSSGDRPGLALRAGLDRDRPTFGLGFTIVLNGLGVTSIDYAFVMEPVSPEATQVLSWRFFLMP